MPFDIITNSFEKGGEMRLSKDQAAQNRSAIVDAASRLFRERGYDAVGLTELMKEAGFSHGGFYNHFDSKEALASEAYQASFDYYLSRLTHQLENSDATKKDALRACLKAYLSPAHRNDPANGCPAASLAVDAMRRDESVQARYSEGIEAYISIFAKQLSSSNNQTSDTEQVNNREAAISLLTQLVGALVLSRAIAKYNPALSNEVLDTAEKTIDSKLGADEFKARSNVLFRNAKSP